MTTRDRHLDATRSAILEAAHELLVERAGTDFSVQAVADRAGLTHRTVYRHFPSREELLITAAVRKVFATPSGPASPFTSLDGWIDSLATRFAEAEANFRMLRQVLGAVLASDLYRPREGEPAGRFDHEFGLFRREFPMLPPDELREEFAIFRQLGSTMTYIAFRTDFGLSPEHATTTIQGTLRAIASRLAAVAPPGGPDGSAAR
ncbi:TetR/AcrR family transcriptional regulator [Agromyces sp. SYSU T0242]|uniref:TetR/AcrR family transcriptional regulator n=1 Tax=Agromyces litoreus TaxID=3158561 RepID=UPI0033966EE7